MGSAITSVSATATTPANPHKAAKRLKFTANFNSSGMMERRDWGEVRQGLKQSRIALDGELEEKQHQEDKEHEDDLAQFAF